MFVRVLAVRPRPGRRPADRPQLAPGSSSPSSSRRPVLVPSSPSDSRLPLVRVRWDEFRNLDVAVCSQCAESFSSSGWGEVDNWADAHRCDAELAALLASFPRRAA